MRTYDSIFGPVGVHHVYWLLSTVWLCGKYPPAPPCWYYTETSHILLFISLVYRAVVKTDKLLYKTKYQLSAGIELRKLTNTAVTVAWGMIFKNEKIFMANL